MLIVCYCLERRVHEAGHFRSKSRKLPLIVNLVQLSGRDKNEGPTEPAHRVIEQVQKFDAQVIVLYSENKNIELLLQQVRIRSLLSFKSALFHQRKFHNSSFESVSYPVTEALSARKDICMDHSRTGLTLELAKSISKVKKELLF